jgi:hypothetical protein
MQQLCPADASCRSAAMKVFPSTNDILASSSTLEQNFHLFGEVNPSSLKGRKASPACFAGKVHISVSHQGENLDSPFGV